MVCVRSFLLLCQHFYTPSWPLPIRWTGISQKGLVSPGICPYKNCVSIFFTRLLLRPSSPRIPKEKEVRHHAVMLWITHLVTFVVLRCILSWVIWLERTSVRTWCVMVRFRLLTQTFGWYAGFQSGGGGSLSHVRHRDEPMSDLIPSWESSLRSEDCFYYCSERKNVVVLFGTLKVQSFILTEVSDCGLLIVVTCSTFLKRKDMLNEKSS